jgi:hypothetical protein
MNGRAPPPTVPQPWANVCSVGSLRATTVFLSGDPSEGTGVVAVECDFPAAALQRALRATREMVFGSVQRNDIFLKTFDEMSFCMEPRVPGGLRQWETGEKENLKLICINGISISVEIQTN